MPQYPQARMTARDRKLAQLQQLQQNDLQQQQADQQQQQAMLAQVSQLYGLQQAQQMDPVRMQAAELANQQAQYGLDRAQQFDPVQLQALQGGVEAQALQNGYMPKQFDMQQQTGQSNLDSAAQQRVLAGNQDARLAAQHPLQLEAARLANAHQGIANQYQVPQLEQTLNLGNVQLRGGQLANDATGLRNEMLPTLLEQQVRQGESGIAGQDVQNQMQQVLLQAQPENIRLAQATAQQGLDTGQIQLNYLPQQLQQQLSNQKDAGTHTRASTVQIMNPGIGQIAAPVQAGVYANTITGPGIMEEIQQQKNARLAFLASMGLDPQGNPLPTPQAASTATPQSLVESISLNPFAAIPDPRDYMMDPMAQFGPAVQSFGNKAKNVEKNAFDFLSRTRKKNLGQPTQ